MLKKTAVYQAASYPRMMVARFFGPANPATIAEYANDVRRLYTAAGRKPVSVVVLVGSLKLPDTATRAAMKNLSAETKEMVLSNHLVIEGTGVAATMMRTIIDGLAVLMGSPRGSMVFHSSPELAIRAACADVNLPADPIVFDWSSRSRETAA